MNFFFFPKEKRKVKIVKPSDGKWLIDVTIHTLTFIIVDVNFNRLFFVNYNLIRHYFSKE